MVDMPSNQTKLNHYSTEDAYIIIHSMYFIIK